MAKKNYFNCKINKLSHDGRGVAKMEGKTIFVVNALPDEVVDISLFKSHQKYDEGVAIKILEQSTTRVIPKCEYFGICGGCSLQHLLAHTQLKYKETILLEHLQHQAQCVPKEVLSPITSAAWHYRRKVRLAVLYTQKNNQLKIGFYEYNSKRIINITHCEISNSAINNAIAKLHDLLIQLKAKNHIIEIEIAVADNATAIVIQHLNSFCEADLKTLNLFSVKNHYQIYLKPNYSITSSELYYDLKKYNIRLYFKPTQFIQINDSVNQKMIAQSMALLDLNPNDHVLDLFCGIGNFSLPLAKQVKNVVGVECMESAVLQARENAEYNQIKNIEFYTQDLTHSLENAKWKNRQFNKILLDPPRHGAIEILSYFSTWTPERIVYISCNPITLARDSKSLLNLGYTLEKVCVMDMFPQTTHVECIALFLRESHGRKSKRK